MSNVLLGAQTVNSLASNCRMQAVSEQALIKHSSTVRLDASSESCQHASHQSGRTQQNLPASESNNDHNAAPTAAEALAGDRPAAAAGKQPASPDSVNAGQLPHAHGTPAQTAASSSPLPSATAVLSDPSLPQHSAPARLDLQEAAAGHDDDDDDDDAGDGSAAVVQHMHLQEIEQQENEPQQEHHAQLQDSMRSTEQDGQELLEPLSPPDASEDAEVHAEYDLYLQRWSAGNTLRQRWHRLKAKGLLADIQGEWDDWQHDLLLDTIQLQLSNPGAVTAQPARQRRGRAEMEGSAAAGSTSAVASAVAGSQEPRRVRTRRAPASFQDFHVETPAAGSPDRTDISLQGLSASDVQRRMMGLHQQQHYQQALQPAPAGCWDGTHRGSQRPQQPPLQQLPRQSNLSRPMQQQQSATLQQRRGAQGSQQQPHHQQQQGNPLSEEFMQKFRATIEMVRSSGNVVGMEGAATLLADPDALKAFVLAISQHTDNPAAAMHRMIATLAGQSAQQ